MKAITQQYLELKEKIRFEREELEKTIEWIKKFQPQRNNEDKQEIKK